MITGKLIADMFTQFEIEIREFQITWMHVKSLRCVTALNKPGDLRFPNFSDVTTKLSKHVRYQFPRGHPLLDSRLTNQVAPAKQYFRLKLEFRELFGERVRRARTEAAEAEILYVLFFKTGSDVCYQSFADAQQADWLIRNAQITWIQSTRTTLKIRSTLRWSYTKNTEFFALGHN